MRRRPLFSLRSVALVALLSTGCGGGVPILMYHSVGPGTDPLGVSEAELDSHLAYLVTAGYHTVTLHDLIEDQQGRGHLPANPIVLTFDDGTQDAYATALPLLTKRGQRATFFIVAGFVAADAEHRRVEPGRYGQRSFMVWSEVKGMRDAGMEIGSHSLRHPRMTSLPRPEMRNEVFLSKQILEQGLGQPVEFFAYPYTVRGKGTGDMVAAAGYRGAVSGVRGSLDPRDLQRLVVHRGLSAQDLRALLSSDWAASYSTGGR
jgi:peptidoglycan/xylan/chitin deacetylase (PgdA/CDA1 family)